MSETRTTKSKERPGAETAAAKSDEERAFQSLTRHLALRDHSRFELKTKLERRFESSLVEFVLTEAAKKGLLLNEDKVAENLIMSLTRKFKSHRYIEAELERRRLPSLPRPEAGEDLEKIRRLVARKFGVKRLSLEDKAKAYRFLKYRGFEDHAIKQVLNEKR